MSSKADGGSEGSGDLDNDSETGGLQEGGRGD